MNTPAELRIIQENEIGLLKECLAELAGHHNMASTHFKGYYPRKPYVEVIDKFRRQVSKGIACIAVVCKNDTIVGFCKCDVEDDKYGKLDYLVVMESYRGNGYGNMLMEWAMNFFEKNGIKIIEVKVVDGNEAIHLYEKYGFKIASHVLWRINKR